MEDLFLKKTFNSPEIEFLAESGELSLEGRSIPEDPGEFFERLIDWINEYFLNPVENGGEHQARIHQLRILQIHAGTAEDHEDQP